MAAICCPQPPCWSRGPLTAGTADALTLPVPVSIWEFHEPPPGLENLPEGFSGFDDNW